MSKRSREIRFAAARQVRHFPWRTAGGSAAVGALGTFGTMHGVSPISEYLMAGGDVTCLGAGAYWWLRRVAAPQSVQRWMIRDGERTQRTSGAAGWLDIQELASRKALRLDTATLRPSLAGQKRVPPNQLGTLVATLGWQSRWGQEIWVPREEHTLTDGAPRRGKTASAMCFGMDAPGGLITTSTKLDLAGGMHEARSVDELGFPRAVHFLNLACFGGRESTVRWSVLDGCGDYPTAMRRAESMIPVQGDEELERWDGPARSVLGLLMHAAAIGGQRMLDVQRWVPATLGTATAAEPLTLLSSVTGGSAMVANLAGHFALNDKTRTSVNKSLNGALAWMSDAAARELGDAEEAGFDIPGLIDRRETLHIIGGDARSDLAPLITCVVGEIAYVALQKAGRSPGGRLDPPLTMILDEAAKTCPAPLDRWTSDFGGQGITLHILVQSIPQLEEKWGTAGARAILTNATYITFGGSKDSQSAKGIVDVLGEWREQLIDRDGKKDIEAFEWRYRPWATASDLNRMRKFEVVVLRSGMGPVKGHSPRPWKRRGWKPVELQVPELRAAEWEDLTEEIPVVRAIPVMARVLAFFQSPGAHHGAQPEAGDGVA